MATKRNDPTFWTDINTLREPAYTPFDPDDTIGLRDTLQETANEFASLISTRDQDYRRDGQEPPPGIVLSGDYQLALLHMLRQMEVTVQSMAADAAKVAGHQGASYVHLGQAWGITRQSARKKWPNAVPARNGGGPEDLPLDFAGGRASVSIAYDTEQWFYTATGADGQYTETEPLYPTSTAAIAEATAYLLQHTQERSS